VKTVKQKRIKSADNNTAKVTYAKKMSAFWRNTATPGQLLGWKSVSITSQQALWIILHVCIACILVHQPHTNLTDHSQTH